MVFAFCIKICYAICRAITPIYRYAFDFNKGNKMTHYIEYFSPVTRLGGIVTMIVDGKQTERFSRAEAEKIAEESNRKFKPLQYTVKEFR